MKQFIFLFASAFIFEICFANSCQICQFSHFQEIFCNSEFVGMVRITKTDVNKKAISSDLADQIVAEMVILKIYKGKYEDYAEGSSIYLYEPTDPGCTREYWKDDILISGSPFNGGLLSSKCDLREQISTISAKQLKTIQENIHNRVYYEGCRYCEIKGPYHHSLLKPNQCVQKYDEFPISTSVCVPVGDKGQCRMMKNSRHSYVVPEQPTAIVANDYIPQFPLFVPKEGTGVGLCQRIRDAAATASTVVIEEPDTTPPTTTTTTTTPTTTIPTTTLSRIGFLRRMWKKNGSRFYRASLDWSKS